MLKFLNFKTFKNSFIIYNLKFIIATAIVAFALLFANSRPVLGQTISLSIWPPLLEVQMVPGKSVIQNYSLTNNTDSFLEITPIIAPFEPDGENGQIKILPADNSPYFFSFSTPEKFNQVFTLDSQETKQLALKISLPKSGSEKDYYFTLLFSTAPKKETRQNRTSSVTQIGTNILLTSSRIENPPLLGRIFKFSTPFIVDSFSPVEFTVILENFGRTFWKPFGSLKIEGLLKQKTSISLLEQNVLANSQRKLTIPSFKPSLPVGPFKARIEFTLNEGPTQPRLSSEISFWYLPYKLAGVLLLLIVLILAFRPFLRLSRGLTKP